MPPRIDDIYLDCTIYLYPDEASARSGERIGGSGFVVGKPFPASGENHVTTWLVTNRHFIEEGSWTVRVNTHAGEFDTIDTTEGDWFYHPDGDDLAVCLFRHSSGRHKFSHVPLSQFLTERKLEDYAIGPGDPGFVVGRFVNHEGRQRNNPTVRFGQIAQMPIERIGEKREQESFLVEIRSIGGYSGSPVFLYLDRTYYRPITSMVTEDGENIGRGLFEAGPWLLGIDWCMVPSWERVCDENGRELPNLWKVPANTGMMGVIPAWRLYSLLMEHEPVIQYTKDIEEQELAKQAASPPSVILTSAKHEPTTTVDNLSHKEDFNHLLISAVTRKKSDDQT